MADLQSAALATWLRGQIIVSCLEPNNLRSRLKAVSQLIRLVWRGRDTTGLSPNVNRQFRFVTLAAILPKRPVAGRGNLPDSPLWLEAEPVPLCNVDLSTSYDVMDRVLDPFTDCFTPEARKVADLRADTETQAASLLTMFVTLVRRPAANRHAPFVPRLSMMFVNLVALTGRSTISLPS